MKEKLDVNIQNRTPVYFHENCGRYTLPEIEFVGYWNEDEQIFIPLPIFEKTVEWFCKAYQRYTNVVLTVSTELHNGHYDIVEDKAPSYRTVWTNYDYDYERRANKIDGHLINSILYVDYPPFS